MNDSTKTFEAPAEVNPQEFWRSDRDQYHVEGAFREDSIGRLYYPVPQTKANRWVIVREVYLDWYIDTDRVLIGEFEDVSVAEQICFLIEATKSR